MPVIALSPGLAFEVKLVRADASEAAQPGTIVRGTVAVLDGNMKRVMVSWLPTDMSFEEFEKLSFKQINLSMTPATRPPEAHKV